MIRYNSRNQLSLDLFETPFERDLDCNNRWVKLADILPWDALASIYYRELSSDHGAPSKDARLVIGAVIIKHKMKLSDREVIAQIQENPYLQYFVGLERFTTERVFDPSLMPKIRKRLGVDKFEAMNEALLVKAGMIEQKNEAEAPDRDQNEPPAGGDDGPTQPAEAPLEQPIAEDQPSHKGKLLIDAVVTEQMIKYPNDLELLNDSRAEAERLIDLLYDRKPGLIKPRTYRKVARKEFLRVAKLRKKSGKVLRKAIRKQLGYLRRDLGIIEDLLEESPDKLIRFAYRDLKIYWVIQHIYRQQQEMFDLRVKRCDDRIVNIYQPWVRPMVTGKASKKVEFGPKSSVSLIDGYASVFRICWDNFNEGGDLQAQVEAYKSRYGYYPEAVCVDQKYGTRANRKWLKENGIRFSGKALGRPKKNPELDDILLEKLKKEEQRLRSQIEGKFGQGKNGYNLAKIRAKLISTSESWLASIYFVMNLIKFLCPKWTDKVDSRKWHSQLAAWEGRFRAIIRFLAPDKSLPVSLEMGRAPRK